MEELKNTLAEVHNLEKTVDELKEQLKEKESKMDKVKLF